ncbi:hypothetical protein BB560_000039 [Smittium megazygosporum]|uniref:RING-type domain-containing protein n=1 Tax=Smittium megazygosporum TaxID=133381 RepID=A0A2T9ZLH1_9FUNG|nr:hypothetical protein BB560_000039 [Smittium megazygosporum]
MCNKKESQKKLGNTTFLNSLAPLSKPKIMINPPTNKNITEHQIILEKTLNKSSFYSSITNNPIWIQNISQSSNIALYLPKDLDPFFLEENFLEKSLNSININAPDYAQVYSDIFNLTSEQHDDSIGSGKLEGFIYLLNGLKVTVFSEKNTPLWCRSLISYQDPKNVSFKNTDEHENQAHPSSSGENKAQPSEIDIKYIFGNSELFLCNSCNKSFRLSQFILQKAISRQKYTCESCGREGFFRFSREPTLVGNQGYQGNAEEGLFELEILSLDHLSSKNIEIIDELAKADQFNTLIVLGNPSNSFYKENVFESIAQNSKNIIRIQIEEKNAQNPVISENNSSENTKPNGPANDVSTENKKRGKPKNREKVSINHLLNFSLPPRNLETNFRPSRTNYKQKHISFDREAFVFSNFRFMLEPKKANEQLYTNPDFKLSWGDVLLVIADSSGSLQCPICLDTPIVPRITRCGHIYCKVCVLRFFSEVAELKHQCPVCSFSMEKVDLKRVSLCEKFNTVSADKNRSTIEMRLIRRDVDSVVSLPANSEFWNRSEVPLLYEFGSRLPFGDLDPDVQIFSRLMWCSKSQLQTFFLEEILELENYALEFSADPATKVFVNLAIDEIKKEFSSISSIGSNTSNILSAFRVENKLLEKSPNIVDTLPVNDIPDYVSVDGFTDAGTYFFYQSSDGQHIYLSPLDLRVIKEAFLSHGNFLPNILNVPVSFFEQSTQSSEFRKRAKVYAHIPLRCDMIIIECDLPSIIPKESLSKFEKKLNSRTKRHEIDKKRAQKAEKELERAAKISQQKNTFSAGVHPHHPIHSQLGMFNDISEELGSSYYSSMHYPSSSNNVDLVPIFGVQALSSEFPELGRSHSLVEETSFSKSNTKPKSAVSFVNDQGSLKNGDDANEPSSSEHVSKFNNQKQTSRNEMAFSKKTVGNRINAWGNRSATKSMMHSSTFPALQNPKTRWENKNLQFIDLGQAISQISLSNNTSSSAPKATSKSKKQKQKSEAKISLTNPNFTRR